MAQITLPNPTFNAGTTAVGSQVISNFTTIYNDYNGNITNVNIASGAAIASTKLNLASLSQTAVSWSLTTANTTTDMLSIVGDTITTAYVIDITADGLTTGSAIRVVSDSANTSSRSLVDIINDNTASVSTNCLRLQQDAGHRAILVDMNANEVAVEFDFDGCTTAIGGFTFGDNLTTGGLWDFKSNSSSTGTRSLILIANDNTAATGAVLLEMQQDANAAHINFTGDSGGDTSSAFSTLTTSGAVQGHIQVQIGGTKRWIAILADPS